MKCVLALLVLGSVVVAGCGGPADPPAPTAPPETPIASMDFESGDVEGQGEVTEGEAAAPSETVSPDAGAADSTPEGDQ